MAIYEFICHDCEVIWEREAAMSKAPSRSRCPECKKLSNRHWGEVPVMFNGDGYYTNTRKQHNLVYNDRAKSKEIQENLLDATKRMSEDATSPYANYKPTEAGMIAHGARRKTEEDRKMSQNTGLEIKKSVYNNSQAYRNLGKR